MSQTVPEPATGAADAAARGAELTVLYDGACPLCRREVGMYKGLTPLEPLAWRDVSQPDAILPAGGAAPEDRAAYLARFHVQRADGQVLSGAAAFVALWSALPGWRWLGRVGALPGGYGLSRSAFKRRAFPSAPPSDCFVHRSGSKLRRCHTRMLRRAVTNMKPR